MTLSPAWVAAQATNDVPAAKAAPGDDTASDDKPGDDKDDKDKSDDKAGDKKPAADADPSTRKLEVTGSQCEALSLGKTIKDLPNDAQVDTISFTDPPPVTFRLPDQRREALTECSLRASGLTVRVDPGRKAILLLPSGTGSPEFPNPKVRVSLKLGAAEPAKPDQ
ncbi:MAG: hypothetical protein JO021_19790 [Alphaproteobacteria bacterium]|nr:hypothetical protein [Alphaproteobacteria bacterium]